ncbi:Histidine kinase-, DNA gyrase B-, and HSP90-like ATPase [Alteromonadaceae bacterium Bs31]|nr:Histidine kinase-, DNA gyrase B-, and HSP90-like ATPase [Alteromonadaceae bacterium Bs31]
MKRRSLESYIVWTIFIVSAPISLLALSLAIKGGYSVFLISLCAILQASLIAAAAYNARHQLALRLRGLATVVESAMLGDYSLKARAESTHSSLSDLVISINSLSKDLSKEKISTEEKRTLLEKIVQQIQVGIITADDEGRIINMNTSAQRILNVEHASPIERLDKLPLALPKKSPSSEIISLLENDLDKRVFIQQDQYRDAGEQRRLIILTEMDYVLRQEQFKSWEDLIRVISHEINNSLAPISSLSESLHDLICSSTLEAQTRRDMLECTEVISERAKSLANFIAQYRNLSKMEAPVLCAEPIRALIESVLPLFRDIKIHVTATENYTCSIDRSQIQQVLINLIKNAVEAMQASNAADPEGIITISLQQQDNFLVISISDCGGGIKNPRNLFIPFYSTKKGGSGIGLALCRQIAEFHGGSLHLNNREHNLGSVASLRLPLSKH